jgi:three-Cys-motif partner protein
VQAGVGTMEKYNILTGYCHSLSIIMRNNDKPHHLVDACAGSGKVQDYIDRKLIDGSPVRMASTRFVVEERIRDKSKKDEVKCWFIEIDEKTFGLLKTNTDRFSDFSTCIHGDANESLAKILEDMDGEFAFVYIDPFGLGDPVLSYETVAGVLDRPSTELFIHFSFEGVERCAGQLKNIDDLDPTKSKTARSTVRNVDQFMGGPEWRKVWEETPSIRRRNAMLGLYLSELQQHYGLTEHLEMPPGSSRPYFDLIFATRNDTGRKIMHDIMDSKRRRGFASLEEFFGG